MEDFTVIPNKMLRESQLSIPARYLLCVLIKYCGQKDWCYPSQKTLGKQMGYTARYIRDLLKELELNELIKRKRIGFNRTNTYKVTKEFKTIRKQGGNHLGSKVPLNEGTIFPPNSTYTKTKDKKTMEIMREELTEKGIFQPSTIFLKGNLNNERSIYGI